MSFIEKLEITKAGARFYITKVFYSVTSPKSPTRFASISFWKFCYFGSIALLPTLIVFNFYGLYSNQFYFLKADNYVLPLVAIIHFVYLYVIQFKIREGEYPDPQMRNVEFGMYAVMAIYLFKCLETLQILLSYDQFGQHLMPETFFPMGIFLLILQVILLLFTLLSFYHRRVLVGAYDFDQINENLDSWQ